MAVASCKKESIVVQDLLGTASPLSRVETTFEQQLMQMNVASSGMLAVMYIKRRLSMRFCQGKMCITEVIGCLLQCLHSDIQGRCHTKSYPSHLITDALSGYRGGHDPAHTVLQRNTFC